MSVRDMRKGWLAAVFCIMKSSRRSVSTLASIRQRLMYVAALSEPGEASLISCEIKLRAGQSGDRIGIG